MFIGTIDMWISRYAGQDIDLSETATLQAMLEDDLRETVPLNLIRASVHRVTIIMGS